MSVQRNELLDHILIQKPLTTLEKEDFMDELKKDLQGYVSNDIEFWDNLIDKAFQNIKNARESQLDKCQEVS